MNKNILTLLFILSLSLGIYSQELSVKSFSLAQTDLSAQTSPRADLNGRNCALVKVQFVGDIIDVEGSVIKPWVRYNNETWVYMTQNSPKMQITASNYLPLMVTFSDYGINRLESNRTYILTIILSGNSSLNQKQILNISFSPINASVIIDNEIVEANNGKTSISLPVGKHEFLITAKGYESENGTINLKSSAPSKLNIELTKKDSGSIPSSASVTFSDDFSGDQFGMFGYNLTVKKTLGAELRVVNKQEMKDMDIKYGLKIISVNDGKLKESGVPVNFVILSVNEKAIKSISDLSAVIKSEQKSRDPVLIVKGCTPGGTIKYFAVPIDQDK